MGDGAVKPLPNPPLKGGNDQLKNLLLATKEKKSETQYYELQITQITRIR